MKPRLASLRARLLTLWALSLLACAAIAMLLVQFYQESTEAQVARAASEIARACDLIRDGYNDALGLHEKGDDLVAVVGLALARQEGVEGGIWQADAGPLAYAFPTYRGSGPKTDLPPAEREQIQTVNREAARDQRPVDHRTVSGDQTLLLSACPLPGAPAGLTGWTMTRVNAVPGYTRLVLGLGVLFALMLLMSAWLGRTLIVWARHVGGIERALAATGGDPMPAIARTGERELDRVIDALNDAGRRLAETRRASEALSARVARAERLASLGRVAAGVAHEIRNPIAAARLQGENALAGDDRRRMQAISDMLAQLERLDALVGELLAMTQRVEPKPVAVDLPGFLAEQAGRHAAVAADKGVRIDTRSDGGTVMLDPAVVGRILDNLLANAIRHAPEGGRVIVAAHRQQEELVITVEDTGSGVPGDMADRLFEPFATGRADGTGLGLAIARELADAHGGRLELLRAVGRTAGEGAMFALILPSRPACQPS
ncbi:MAG TPA: ATP-binding protein [Acetobacteraceae bacterium]|jgi:hypothetical protein